MKKIAILGGSFNPIHNGHIMIAEAAYTQFDIDEIWIMPNNAVYYKSAIKVSDEDRNNMIRLAIEDRPYMKLSTIEQDRGGITYTIDTMNYLWNEFSDTDFYFIIGGDSLKSLHMWKESDILLNRLHFLAAIRDDIDLSESEEIIKDYKIKYPNSDIKLIITENSKASSSFIRENINSEEAKGYLTEKVYDYIKNKKLYM